jgi:hypothetical protein
MIQLVNFSLGSKIYLMRLECQLKQMFPFFQPNLEEACFLVLKLLDDQKGLLKSLIVRACIFHIAYPILQSVLWSAPMFNIRVSPLPFCSFFDSARKVPLADDIDYVAVYDWLDVELVRHMLDGFGLLLWRNYCFWCLIYSATFIYNFSSYIWHQGTRGW